MHRKCWEQCIIYGSKHLREQRGAYCYKASVKSLNMSQLSLQRSDQKEAWVRGWRGCWTGLPWPVSIKPLNVSSWVRPQLEIPATHPDHSNRGSASKRLRIHQKLRLSEASTDSLRLFKEPTKRGPNNQSLHDSVTFVLFLFNWGEEMSHSSHYPQHRVFNLCAM